MEKRNFFEAYKKVVANKGSSGIDGMRVDELLPYLKENYETLKANLLNGEYKPQAVKRVEIPKPNGGVRLLGIPIVVDRLIQQAINLDELDEQLERRGHRFCRYADDCAPQRWHELNTGVCTERGKPWADVKRVYQAEEPELFSFKGKSTLKGGGAYARNKAV